jgi:hypothetical protein
VAFGDFEGFVLRGERGCGCFDQIPKMRAVVVGRQFVVSADVSLAGLELALVIKGSKTEIRWHARERLGPGESAFEVHLKLQSLGDTPTQSPVYVLWAYALPGCTNVANTSLSVPTIRRYILSLLRTLVRLALVNVRACPFAFRR